MIYKTKGICLHTLKYGESSVISKVFTEHFGLRSYIVHGVHSKKSKAALFQPLSILDLVVYEKEGKGIQKISDVHLGYPYQTIPFHPVKTAIALFLSECLSKVLKVESEDEILFHFIIDSLILFDSITIGLSNFHLHFLLQLAEHLGFGLYIPEQKGLPLGYFGSEPEVEKKFFPLLYLGCTWEGIQLNHSQRKYLLERLIFWYQKNWDQFGELRSLPVLKDLFQ